MATQSHLSRFKLYRVEVITVNMTSYVPPQNLRPKMNPNESETAWRASPRTAEAQEDLQEDDQFPQVEHEILPNYSIRVLNHSSGLFHSNDCDA